MKHIVRALIVVGISAVLSLVPIKLAPSVFATLYTVIGIAFSIGYSVVIGFDLSEITNERFIANLRRNLKITERTFIAYFTVATVSFLLADQSPAPLVIRKYCFSWDTFSAVASLYILAHLVVNYSTLQKLKDDIADHLRNEKLKQLEE